MIRRMAGLLAISSTEKDLTFYSHLVVHGVLPAPATNNRLAHVRPDTAPRSFLTLSSSSGS